ncbi:MAG: multicopper oxidase family protein [Fibrobacteres bacterium]|nr:multicopper oxidase family protein [Fibrobacterota bacterium]
MAKFPTRIALGILGAWAVLACGDKASAPVETGAKVPYDASVEGLPEAKAMGTLEAKDGDTVHLTVSYVAKWVSGRKVRMLAYNGSVPGPIVKVSQGASIVVLVKNETDLPTSLHSHGVRLDSDYDGVVAEDKGAPGPGQTFAYHVRFPDAGIYWYHPHTRSDYQTQVGLYGAYLVAPADPAYWPPVNREIVLMINDLAISGNVLQPFYRNETDHTLMGRFGNVLMVNGDTACTIRVKRNETIRFYVVNASNARVYNLQYSRDMDMNIVGADNGRFVLPDSRESYLIAPSERFIYQLYFNDVLSDYDTLDLWNATPTGARPLAHFVYEPDTAMPDYRSSINLDSCPQAAASIDPFRPYFDKSPDEEILLTGFMAMSKPLAKAALLSATNALAKAAAVAHDADPSNRLGVEWSDSVHGPAMLSMNDSSTDANTHWAIRDLRTGKENHDIQWTFSKGDKILIRVHNDTTTTGPDASIMYHSMPHPLHFHGQRFLVVRENGRPTLESLVWRDTYLIGRGYTVDLLLDASNPGDWMFHCHIAEHLEDDMMAHFRVVDSGGDAPRPYEWSLGLPWAGIDSLRRDTSLAVLMRAAITGTVRARPTPGAADIPLAAALDGKIYLSNADFPDLHAEAAFDAAGRFTVAADAVLGAADIVRLKIWVKGVTSGLRPVPDTLHLVLDRRGKIPWSLDLDLAGEASFAGLKMDTSAVSTMRGQVAGKVNGYDGTVMRDSLYFRNMVYPEMFAYAPLKPDGTFSFDAADLVGALDGRHEIEIFLRPQAGSRRFDPDTLRVHLSIP